MNNDLKRKVSSLLAFVMIFTTVLSNVFTVNAADMFSKIVNDDVVSSNAITITNVKDITTTDPSIDLPGSEFGKTYFYDFATGDIFGTDSSNTVSGTISSEDGVVEFDATNAESPAYYHDATHGVALYAGTKIYVNVPGTSRITFGGCKYGAINDVMAIAGTGTISPTTFPLKTEGDGDTFSFEYKGEATKLEFDIKGSGESYLHNIKVSNSDKVPETNGKIDVWDFGAYQFDTDKYNNHLTESVINGWYEGIVPGTGGQTLPKEVKADRLTIVGTGNDRLRTKNTNLTRYDENAGEGKKGIESEENIAGSLYFNGTNAQSIIKYLSMPLAEDDEVTIVARCDNAEGIEFLNADNEKQRDYAPIDSNGAVYKFVAKTDGTYKIFSKEGANPKAAFYRIYREDATYVDISGTIEKPETLNNYELIFTNDYTGKEFSADFNGSSYSVKVPGGYGYTLSLTDANGFVIATDLNINVAKDAVTMTNDVKIESVELYKVNGEVKGFDESYDLSNLELEFKPAVETLYVPEVTISGASYEVQLQPELLYNLEVKGVNDYSVIDSTEITIFKDNTTININVKAKPKYKVDLDLNTLSQEAKNDATITFTNLNEEGYTYSFKGTETPELRDGVYVVTVTGLDGYQYEMKPVSNVVIDGKDINKTIEFVSGVEEWDFAKMSDEQGNSGKFLGLEFTGAKKNKNYLLASNGASIKIPAQVGSKVSVQFTYAASFSFEDGKVINAGTSAGSTSLNETYSYDYTGTEDGYVTLNVTGTTYFEKMSSVPKVEYKEVLTVGTDKEYKTINDALNAIKYMDREADQRVTVMIDPGNYEEMLVINQNNVTLENANGVNSSIELTNKGVDIAQGAVRITSYYGHGVSYYSMGEDCKYDAALLTANKENGYKSFKNPGSGTTNGSYWNATVVISGDGFEANGIIFENSFNQYISAKEAADVLELNSDNKGGERSKVIGDTSVQDKKYVERAAAMAFLGDKTIFRNCRFVGRQDTLYGDKNIRALFDKCAIMGGTDYIFGGMIAVFNECKLVFNTMEDTNDVGYITAAQQDAGRGYLMYNCTVTSTTPGVDTASTERSKPGLLGRPWKGSTSETVFINTTIEKSNDGKSLIQPVGWSSSLGGVAPVYEYNSIELSGENNSASRVDWATTLTKEDVDKYTFEHFLNGSDGWNPMDTPELKKIKVFMIGDSTVCEYPDDTKNYRSVRNGYGMKLGNYMNDNIEIVNLALSGRSTKDFVTYEQYQTLKNEMGKGDYLIIGFGHNDQKPANADRYSPANQGVEVEGSFKYNLYNSYIKPALEAGTTPILATPIVRRGTSATLTGDKIHQTANGDYSEAIRELGKDLNLTVIDNTNVTNSYYEKIGSENYGILHAEYNDAYMESKKYTNEDGTINESKRIDNTHLNSYGADMVAYFVADAISKSDNSLKVFLKGNLEKLNLLSNVGDVDGNGHLLASDSAATLQYVLNSETININQDYADVNADKAINASDAAAILQRVLDMNFEFNMTKALKY